MKIHVRRRHIKEGRRRNTGLCPIALAFREMSGLDPIVSAGLLCTTGGSFKLSAKTLNFIARFDAGKPVKPFAFVLK